MTKRFARVPIAAASMRGLGEYGFRVLIALGTYSNSAGECWPSLTTIANVTGLRRQKVHEIIGKLETLRLITRSRGRGGAVTHYVIKHEEVSPPQGTASVPSTGDSENEGVPSTGDSGVPSTGDKVSPHQGTEQPIEAAQLNQPTLLSLESENSNHEIDIAVLAWNSIATETGLPTVRKLTKPLRSSLKARLSECSGIDGWHLILDRIRQSDFLCGGSPSGWRASLQWAVTPANFEKIIAGNYDRSERQAPRQRSGKVQDIQAALAEAQHEAFDD